MTAAARARTPDEGKNPAGRGELLTTAETAALLRRAPKTLRSWRYLGRGPAYVAGGRVMYRRGDVELWLDAHRRTPEAR